MLTAADGRGGQTVWRAGVPGYFGSNPGSITNRMTILAVTMAVTMVEKLGSSCKQSLTK
jgi:hypothetical protein